MPQRSERGVFFGPQFQARFRALCSGGPGKLRVITDFDQTLTSFAGVDGRRGDECHGVLLNYLDLDAVPGLKASDWRHLKELDRLYAEGDVPAMAAYAQRLKAGDDLLTWTFDAFQRVSAEFRLWEHVGACLARSNLQLREGLAETFACLRAYGVPLLVVSAGLRQVIQGILQVHGCPFPPLTSLVTNDLRDPRAAVTPATKNALGLVPRSHAAATAGRTCVLLLGDKASDLEPARGLKEECVVLSVCFLAAGLKEGREPTALEIQEGLQHFDVVLTNDAPMHFVNGLLQSVARGSGSGLFGACAL